MAKNIVVTSKDHTFLTLSQDSIEGYAFGLAVVDRTDGKTIPAVFEQTQSLTSALIGITDYGAMFINTATTPESMLSEEVTIKANLLDGSGESVTYTDTVQDLMDATVGPLSK